MIDFFIAHRGSGLLFSAVAAYFIACSAWAASPEKNAIDWREWSPGVFEQARREGRLVFLDLTAEWCLFCRKMDETTYRDPRVIDIIDRGYIPVRADYDTSPDLAKRYRNYGPPTTVVFNAKGTEVIKKRGYLRPQWMVWLLEAVLLDSSPEAHH